MAHPAVDKFGEFIITRFRDRSIDYFDALAEGLWKAPALKEIQADLATLTEEQRALVRRCVISTLDNGLHDLLFAFVEAHDCEEGIDVIVDGQNVAELSDGLNGEQFSDQGWIAKFGSYTEQGDSVDRDDE